MITDRAALIVPSRSRPQNIRRLHEALIKTESKVDLYVGLDADDPNLDEYKILEAELDNVTLDISPERQRFGPTLNRIALELADKYLYLIWLGDDHLPRTKHWDEQYRRELEKIRVGMVYGDDLIQGINIPTQMGFTSNLVKALGYAVPEGFIHLFIDNYFLELCKAIDKVVYRPDVVVQHIHYSVGGAEEDLTYKEANSSEHWSNDRIRFQKYLSEELEADAKKLRKLL